VYNRKRDSIIAQVVRDGEISNVEIQFRRKNGEILDTLFSSKFVEMGGKRYLFSRTHDITERKIMERALRESEAQFRNIIEHSGDVFYMFDLDARPLYLSPRAIDMLGIIDEFNNIKWTDYLTYGLRTGSHCQHNGSYQDRAETTAISWNLSESDTIVTAEVNESP
jgi:PAS domain S-box-containing protein